MSKGQETAPRTTRVPDTAPRSTRKAASESRLGKPRREPLAPVYPEV